MARSTTGPIVPLLIGLLGAGCGLPSSEAVRESFVDAFLTPDQRGRLAYERGAYGEAARLFVDPTWKALATYGSGDFASAEALFSQLDSPEAAFQLGNSRAQQEDLAGAVEAYDRALALRPDFPEARFNRDWVAGLKDLAEKQYEDAGGTGGKLGADGVVFDDRAKDAVGDMTAQQAAAQGLSDSEIEAMWMRRVQTTPGDFLRLKFAQQLHAPSGSGSADGGAP